MKKMEQRPIQIRLPGGELIPFQVYDLQHGIEQSFRNAGQSESAYLAGEIALAAEYALRHSIREEPVFESAEVGDAVIRILEETGFPEAAAGFRQENGPSAADLECSREGIRSVLKNFSSVMPEHFEKICGEVMQALQKLEFPSAPPQLILELARCYENRLRELPLMPDGHPLQNHVKISRQQLLEKLLPHTRQLVESGILDVNAISALFPAIRLTVRLWTLARQQELHPPVTELELHAQWNELAAALADMCSAADGENPDGKEPLPVVLIMPDAIDFAVDYLECERFGAVRPLQEIAELLTAALPRVPFKITFSEGF